MSPAVHKTLIEVNKSPTRNGQQHQQRHVVSSDPWSQAKIDVTRNDSFHGTPRSVKNRKNSRQQKDAVDCRSKSTTLLDNNNVEYSCHEATTQRNNNYNAISNDKIKNNSSDLIVQLAKSPTNVDEQPTATVEASTSKIVLTIPADPQVVSATNTEVIF